MEEVKKVKTNKAAKVIAIIIFSVIMAGLLAAIISDISIFSSQIGDFLGACIVSAIVFLFGCVLMIVSVMFIFGVYLLTTQGFWPATWASTTFKEILEDIEVSSNQLAAFRTIRIILLVICIIVFIMAIICLALAKSFKKKNPELKQGLTNTFGILSLVFSILGMMAAIMLLIILHVTI